MALVPRGRSYWVAQVVGWTAFALVQHLALLPTLLDTSTCGQLSHFLAKLWKAGLGLLVSVVLEQVYARLWTRRPALPLFGVSVVSASLALGGVWALLYRLSLPVVGSPVPELATLPRDILNHGVVLLAWSALWLSFAYRRELAVERERALEAAALAARAELEMLRYQVHPHFLFNALNSLRALIDEDPARARRMVTELSELFRHALLAGRTGWTTLDAELDAVRNYLAVQKVRFEERLRIEVDAQPGTGELRVPSFLLHPLVENAVKYGMETSPLPLEIAVRARVVDDELRLVVENRGEWLERGVGSLPGPPPPPPVDKEARISGSLSAASVVAAMRRRQASGAPEPPPGTGTGLANLRRRLAHLLPERHRLSIEAIDGRVRVILALPAQLASTAEAAS
jgi:two-component system LytT family sensor kinase